LELLIVVAIILTLAAIAIPNFLRSRIAANESAAVANLRRISTAEIAYSSTYPNIGYTCSLTDLGPPASGNPMTSTAAGVLDAVLASGGKQGYSFGVTNCSGSANASYNSAATPTDSTTGVRSFCSDASGIIRYSGDGTASSCQSSGAILN